MSVQLNNMSTAKVRNRKARQLAHVIRKYEVHFVLAWERLE
jgi:beta-xylosidase